MGDVIALEWRQLAAIEKVVVVLTSAIAILSIAFAIFNYPVIGHDSFLHLNWLKQFTELREAGINYPRWLPEGFHGLGSPAFYYYPPLAYFAASAIHSTVGGSPEVLYHALRLIFAVIGTLILLLVLCQRGTLRILALTSSLAFNFGGYLFIDAFIRNALGEEVALAFLPALLFRSRTRIGYIAVVAFTMSVLLFSNIPVAIVGLLILIARTVKHPKTIADTIVGGIVAALAAVIYWYPALSISYLIRIEHLQDAIVRESPYIHTVREALAGRIDRLHLVMAVTLVAGALLVIHRLQHHPREALTWLLTAAVLLQLPYLTDRLWQSVLPFTYLQFSWRLNAVVWLVLVYDFAMRESVARYLVLALILITFGISTPLIPRLVSHEGIPDDPIRYDAPEHATRWTPASLWEFYHLAMRHGGDPDVVIESAGSVITTRRTPTDRQYELDLTKPATAQLHLMYWPYWKAYVNGEVVTLGQRDGIATINLPGGRSHVELKLEGSSAEKTGVALSMVGATVLIVVLGAASYNDLRKRALS